MEFSEFGGFLVFRLNFCLIGWFCDFGNLGICGFDWILGNLVQSFCVWGCECRALCKVVHLEAFRGCAFSGFAFLRVLLLGCWWY